MLCIIARRFVNKKIQRTKLYAEMFTDHASAVYFWSRKSSAFIHAFIHRNKTSINTKDVYINWTSLKSTLSVGNCISSSFEICKSKSAELIYFIPKFLVDSSIFESVRTIVPNRVPSQK